MAGIGRLIGLRFNLRSLPPPCCEFEEPFEFACCWRADDVAREHSQLLVDLHFDCAAAGEHVVKAEIFDMFGAMHAVGPPVFADLIE